MPSALQNKELNWVDAASGLIPGKQEELQGVTGLPSVRSVVPCYVARAIAARRGAPVKDSRAGTTARIALGPEYSLSLPA